jgi:hypothetical protein
MQIKNILVVSLLSILTIKAHDPLPDGPSRDHCTKALLAAITCEIKNKNCSTNNGNMDDLFRKCEMHGDKKKFFELATEQAVKENNTRLALECQKLSFKENKSWIDKWNGFVAIGTFIVGLGIRSVLGGSNPPNG